MDISSETNNITDIIKGVLKKLEVIENSIRNTECNTALTKYIENNILDIISELYDISSHSRNSIIYKIENIENDYLVEIADLKKRVSELEDVRE
jgi:hypothetical protein